MVSRLVKIIKISLKRIFVCFVREMEGFIGFIDR